MEAPEKVYLNPARYSLWRDYEDEWSDTSDGEGSVEYTRTDVFIKKACKWLYEYCRYGCCEYIEKNDFINDFKKAMEERV